MKGLLLVPGCLYHIVPDVTEHEGDLRARHFDVVQKRRREAAISAAAVEGSRTIASGISDQHIADRLDPAKTAPLIVASGASDPCFPGMAASGSIRRFSQSEEYDHVLQ